MSPTPVFDFENRSEFQKPYFDTFEQVLVPGTIFRLDAPPTYKHWSGICPFAIFKVINIIYHCKGKNVHVYRLKMLSCSNGHYLEGYKSHQCWIAVNSETQEVVKVSQIMWYILGYFNKDHKFPPLSELTVSDGRLICFEPPEDMVLL